MGHYDDRHRDIHDDVPLKAADEPPTWFDAKKNVTLIVWAVYGICAALLVIDPFVHKHGQFEIEHWFGFYGIYGFIGCVFLVLAAKEMRKLIMRPEDYYDAAEDRPREDEGEGSSPQAAQSAVGHQDSSPQAAQGAVGQQDPSPQAAQSAAGQQDPSPQAAQSAAGQDQDQGDHHDP